MSNIIAILLALIICFTQKYAYTKMKHFKQQQYAKTLTPLYFRKFNTAFFITSNILVTISLLLFAYLNNSITSVILFGVMLYILNLISLVDLHALIIPSELICVLVPLAMLFNFVHYNDLLVSTVLVIIAILVCFIINRILRKKYDSAIGMGDIRFYVPCLYLVGSVNMVTFMLVLGLVSLAWIGSIWIYRKSLPKDVAYGPILALASVLTVVIGVI